MSPGTSTEVAKIQRWPGRAGGGWQLAQRDGRSARGLGAGSLLASALLLMALGPALASEFEISAAPGAATADEVARLWAKANELEDKAFELDESEQARQYLSQAAPLFERVGAEQGGTTQGYWRAARATWLAGEFLPLDATDAKMEAFNDALTLTDRGLSVNPDCAECMLWKFIAMGRLRTTSGVWEGIRQVSDMAELLDRAIELDPTHRDNEHNSTLGNLHYSSAIFYRLVPDWFWIGWVLGVKGDKERALDHSHRALALHPQRLDYQVEVGTQLLCLGSVRDDSMRTKQGLDVMRAAIAREARGVDETREIMFARIMLEEPDRACGYVGDKLLEMDEKAARRAAR